MSQASILIVPGRGNSEPGHWQSIVENNMPGTLRVQQENWHHPSLEAWSHRIDQAVHTFNQPPLVVAHSFGCLATAYAQITLGTPIGALLFVAPADPDRFGLDPQLFSNPLCASGKLIASNNDPWVSIKKAIAMAKEWGLEYINLGSAGHINVASGYGSWPEGEAIIESMRSELGNTDPECIHAPTWSPSIRLEHHSL